jgi:glutaredoxin-related protein
MGVLVHRRLHVAALPVWVSVVQAFPSLHVTGQLPGGSHVSGGSTTPFPQTGAQSVSFRALHPGAQHPSPPTQATMGVLVHRRSQVAALPVWESAVQAFPSLHVAGQLPGGSHVSGDSTTPFPHRGRQSLSTRALQLAGQQPSPPEHAVIAVCVHTRLQVAALPVCPSTVQAFPSLQVAGQLPGGSHVSGGSTTLLLHTGAQSVSFRALHPGAQHPSPPVHTVIGVCVHARLHVAALPV